MMKLRPIITIAMAISFSSYAAADDLQLTDYPGFSKNKKQEISTYIKEENAREKYISKCMKKNGFSYFYAPMKVNPNYNSANRNKSPKKDKNVEYFESLSAPQQSEYNIILTGYENPNDPLTAGFPTDNSCVGQSLEVYPGIFSVKAATGSAYAEKMRDIPKRPEMVALHSKWAKCMNLKGTGFVSSPEEFMESAATEFFKASTPEDVEAASFALTEAKEKAKICSIESGLVERFRKSKIKAEREFLLENRSVLDKAHKKYKKQPKIKE